MEGYQFDMKENAISRIDFRNKHRKMDFEMVDLGYFFSTRPHEHLGRDYRLNFWVMLLITEGSGRHYVDFEPYDYQSGDIIFIQKNQVQHFIVDNSAKGYIMHINEPFFYRVEGFDGDIFLEFADKAFGSPIMSFDMTSGSTNRTIIELLYREYIRETAEDKVPLIASLFQSLILSLRTQAHSDNKVLLTRDYETFKIYRQLVEKHYTTTRSVEDYADMMALSKKTVNQATRRVVGLSAKQYIINRTILEIKRYLSQGELMNYEIADVLGFGEAANMTKFFKHYEGKSPKEFREELL